MHSSTLFFLLTVFLIALTISVKAYPGKEEKEEKEKKEEKEESKEGESDSKGEGEGEGESGEKKDEKSSAMSLFNSNGLSAVVSLAVASIILSIH